MKLRQRIIQIMQGIKAWFDKKLPVIEQSLNQVLEISNEVLDVLSEQLVSKDHRHKARFDRASKLISARNDAYSIDGLRFLTTKQARSNLAIVAPSGAGKSQVSVFPSIFNIAKSGASMLINDPHGELSDSTPYLRSVGYQCISFDLDSDQADVYFSPLLRCRDKSSTSKVTQMLLKAGLGSNKEGNGTANYFMTKSTDLVGLIINYLRENQHEDYYNLANVCRLLEHMQAHPERVDQLFLKASEELYTKYLSFKNTSEDTLSSIISTAQASLSFIANDQKLERLTSKDTIDFSRFRSKDEKIAFFVRVPIGDVAYYQKIVGILFEQFFGYMFRQKVTGDEKDVFVVLDEMSAIAPAMGDFANIISSARKFHLPIMGVLQSEAQLHQAFGEHNARTILNNFNTKVYFSGLGDEADKLEKLLGRYSYKENKKDKGHQTRQLMTADEIRTMPRNQVICIASGMRPVKLTVTPAYKQPRLLGYLNMEELTSQTTEMEEDESLDGLPAYEVAYLPLPEPNMPDNPRSNQTSTPNN